jgi:hypothetical protein
MFKKIKLPHQSFKFLFLLLCADTFYVSLHIIHHHLAPSFGALEVIRSDVFDISRDRGLGESFQYAKEFWIAILFLWFIFKRRKTAYTGWAVLFVYLLADDMISIHEKIGTVFIRIIGFSPFVAIGKNLRYQDVGEIGAAAALGLLFLSLLGFAYTRADQETRRTFHYLAGGLMLIVFFGVAFDFVHQLLGKSQIHIPGLTLIEESGEMLSMSLMCWYVYVMTDMEAEME